MHDLTFAMQFACLPAVCRLGPILLQTSNLHDVAFPVLQRVQIFAIKLVRGSLKFCKRGTPGLAAGLMIYLPAACCILSINRARNLIPSGSLVMKIHNSAAA